MRVPRIASVRAIYLRSAGRSAFTAAATRCLTPLFPHRPKLQFPHLDQGVWPCAA